MKHTNNCILVANVKFLRKKLRHQTIYCVEVMLIMQLLSLPDCCKYMLSSLYLHVVK